MESVLPQDLSYIEAYHSKYWDQDLNHDQVSRLLLGTSPGAGEEGCPLSGVRCLSCAA